MEIGAINSALSAVDAASPGTITSAVSMKMLDNTLDLNAELSQDMIKMMENSVNPNIGGNFDMSV